MKLAFHKGSRGTLFSKLICWKTGEPYSHVELVFDFKITTALSLCFSADEKDGGTRFKEIDLNDEWLLVDVPETVANFKKAFNYARKHNNLKYDWLGIIGFVLPFGEHDDNDRFCSEIVCEILQVSLGWWPEVKPWQVSPGRLYELYAAKFFNVSH